LPARGFLLGLYIMQDVLLTLLQQQNVKALARTISLVESEAPGFETLLQQLPAGQGAVIGITGPPGAGKSTLTDALIGEMVGRGKRVGVLCVDPSSPFNRGALLGDRIRMNEWYNHPGVFIRSLASRGNLGGLHPHIIEITDVMKAAGFDYIIIETVGVGQSEVEITGLADVTVVVLVPEAGDDIQTMKAGIMEIADLFVVNKADRPGADRFVHHLQAMLSPSFNKPTPVPVLKTVASAKEGVTAVFSAIETQLQTTRDTDKKYWLLAEKAYYLLQQKRMQDINKAILFEALKTQQVNNLYTFIQQYS
jgi:LAO/AO transport system kinase